MQNEMIDVTYEDYLSRLNAVKQIHKEVEEPKDVEVLGLVMNKESALAIIDGEKRVGYLANNDYYNSILIDKKMLNFFSKYMNDKDVIKACDGWEVKAVLNPVRLVNAINFHDDNRTWALQVEVTMNELLPLTTDNAVMLYEQYGDTGMFEMIEELGKDYDEHHPPYIHYFALGDIIRRENI